MVETGCQTFFSWVLLHQLLIVNGIDITPANPKKFDTVVLTANASGLTSVQWIKDTSTLTSCFVGPGICPSPDVLPGALIEINTATVESTITIDSANQTFHGGHYEATGSLAVDVLVNTLPTTVNWTAQPQGNLTSVSSVEWVAKIYCVYPTSEINVHFTVYVEGVQEVGPRSPTLSIEPDSNCDSPEETVIAKLSLSPSNFLNQKVYIIANASHASFPTEPSVTSGQSAEAIFQGQSQGTDACDNTYWICDLIIAAVNLVFSVGSTVTCLMKRRQLKLKAQNIICCCEKTKWNYRCGISALLLVAFLIILTIITLIVWFISMLIVILAWRASEECDVRGIVAGTSFSIWLIQVLIFEVVFFIVCYIIERGYTLYKVESGDKVTLLKGLTPSEIIRNIAWTHEGNIILSGNSEGGTIECPALTLNMASLNQSGEYTCIITCGSEGQPEQKVYHLKLLVTPKHCEVKIGQNVKLLKSLRNLQNIEWIEWTHSNNTIMESCFYSGGNTNNPILTVNCFATSDSGLYYCRVKTTQAESTNVFSVHLKIKDQKQVSSGESIVLLKKLENSANVTSVVWTHNKKALVSESDCIYDGGNIECPALTIPVVSPKNAGKYECKLGFNQGDSRTYEVFLEVTVPKIKGRIGREVTLLQNISCPHNIDKVEWYINGTRAGIDDHKYQGGLTNSPPLKVGCLGRSDTGRYICDLIISELHIKLHIPVDLEVEEEENSFRPLPLPPVGTSRVYPEV